MKTLILIFASALLSLQAIADEGQLPQGKIIPNPEFIPPQKATVAKSRACSEYDASPMSGHHYVSPSQEYLYLLVKKPRFSKSKIDRSKAGLYTYQLYRLGFLNFDWEVLMSFQKGDISVILPHGKYTDGISFLTYSEFQNGCYLGNAGGFSATLEGNYRGVNKNISSKKFAYGRYKVLPSSLGRAIADMEKNSIIEVDPKFFQRRYTLGFPANNIPIYLDYESRRLITYNQNTQPPQLQLKLENAKSPYKAMKLELNQKYIREGAQFAKMHFEKGGRRVIIHIDQEWTAKKENLYKITLPERYKGDRVAVYPRFVNNTAIVMGLTQGQRKQLRTALVFDLARNKVVHRHVPRPGFYVSYATMGPFGKFAYFVVSHINSGTFHKLFRYDLNKKYYRVLTPIKSAAKAGINSKSEKNSGESKEKELNSVPKKAEYKGK